MTAALISAGREISDPPKDGISNLRFSNHSDHLLVSSWDKTVRLYDASANSLRGEFLHGGAVLDCCFHDDSSGFSASADNTVRRDIHLGTKGVYKINGDGKCTCPPGFKGDGKSCEDIDECKEKRACQCPECNCKNTWGDYECTCSNDLLYMRDHDICISKTAKQVKSSWVGVWVILIGLAAVAGTAYLVYKYRLRTYMDSEIRAIMAQYMPLDSQSEVPSHTGDARA